MVHKIKTKQYKKLQEVIEDWFFSDLDIEFVIKKSKSEKGIFSLESDAYYFEGKRYGGNKRRLIMWEGDDDLYKSLKKMGVFGKNYSLEETKNLIHDLQAGGFKVKNIEDF